MKRFLFAAAVFGMLLGARVAEAGPFGYTIDITTHYQFGGGADAGPSGNPDTGFVTFTNNGTTTFAGNLILDAALPGPVFNTTLGGTLAAGASRVLSLNDESSNQGGYNPVGGGLPQNGVKIELSGFINGTEAVDLIVYDKDVHSGVFGSANGTLSDSYVIQGGDPFGGDTGDNFETAQADGHFRFFEQGPAATPEPASLTLLGIGIVGMAGYSWRKRKQARA